MKIFFSTGLLIVFITGTLHGQNILFEKSLNPDFNSGLNAVTHDTSGNFFAVGGGSYGFSRPGWFIRTDQDGNILSQIPLIERDDNYLQNIFPSADHNFFLCGYNAYCDLGPANQGILYKISPAGNVIWKKVVNPDTALGYCDDNLREVIELKSGKLLLRADSTLYLTDQNGDSLWSIMFSGTVATMGETMNQKIVAGNHSTIFILDTLGQIQNQFAFPYPVYHFNNLPDSTYVILCGSNLLKLDTSFNTMTSSDLSAINFGADLLTKTRSRIFIANTTGADFAAFDFNLTLTDTFRTTAADVSVGGMTVFDSSIVVAGRELSRKNYQYMKSFHTDGTYEYRNTDLALTSIAFDTSYGFHRPGYPPGVNSIAFVATVELFNAGQDTIHSFFINAQSSIVYGPCGYFEYSKHVSNVQFAPGQTMYVSLDTLEESGVVYHPPFTYTFCAWISCPDSVVDKMHANDYLCDSFVVTEILAVENLTENNIPVIYPNPASSSFTISRKDGMASAWLEIVNAIGERIYLSKLNEEIEIIDARLNPGVYFVRVNDGKNQFTQKLVVE